MNRANIHISSLTKCTFIDLACLLEEELHLRGTRGTMQYSYDSELIFICSPRMEISERVGCIFFFLLREI